MYDLTEGVLRFIEAPLFVFVESVQDVEEGKDFRMRALESIWEEVLGSKDKKERHLYPNNKYLLLIETIAGVVM